MMPGRIGHLPIASENPLGLSWHDSAWIPSLNPSNIMDYFSERSNPFFDRTCNNEVVKMQRLSMDQLQNMTGLEYILLHVQEPILYVIRKQHRQSPMQTIPLADYYIIAGIVYQAPDLASVLNSRILSAVHHLQCSFEETMTYSKYHPSKGYWWDHKNKTGPFNVGQSAPKEVSSTPKEEPSTLFQRQRVDMLLAELVRQFPLPVTQTAANQNGVTVKTENTNDKGSEKPQDGSLNNITIKQEPIDPMSSDMTNGMQGHMEIKTEIKQENMKPPPEKKPRT
ncbi:mediator of RNA polymerase II transcription subunit 6 isoform X2 [Danaus plexippus]|uniref:Mediator of RNA polymerase II transcription subunit 6 n=1 Tax=Danaus plexippus plexippus TaxID=278856 RepID=A0A212ETR4_DANPL|nr:mediator of RNA polymerase II transcription subunit 6 isoform X2 [Danaus plexippus]OWR44883.1 Mediator of RNA polymerase 2 transcription subunit 6 [Danaus plexippus plexippus]